MKLRRTVSIPILYLISASLILGIKYWYRSAGSNDLDWILSPTARWVEILGGISFEKIPNLGYINHPLRFIIAPSCSGVQFMLITFTTLCAPFLYRTGTAWRGSLWIAFSLAAAYLYTIAVNGIRIILSISLPAVLARHYSTALYAGWLTPEKLHTMIGTAVYFASLLLVYHGAEILYQRTGILLIPKCPGKIPPHKISSSQMLPGSLLGNKIFPRKIFSGKITGKPFLHALFKYMPPAACYFSIVLAIPLLGRVYRNNWDNFAEYALLTAAVCLAVLLAFTFTRLIIKRDKR